VEGGGAAATGREMWVGLEVLVGGLDGGGCGDRKVGLTEPRASRPAKGS
jgi:hypothetical protein